MWKNVSQKIVEEKVLLYQQYRYEELDTYLLHYSSLNRINSLVYRAAWGKLIDGSTHPHQRRVSKDAKSEMVIRLMIEIEVIMQLSDFHTIWSFIEKLRVDGYGNLAVYDCALRLASTKGIYPEYIYIHQDAKTGAEILLGRTLKQIRFIEQQELLNLYPSLNKLPSYHLENFLCIYCDNFIDEDVASVL